jgi:hypothetical protein
MLNVPSAMAKDAPLDLDGVWMPTVIAPDGSRNRPWPAQPPFLPEVQKAYEEYQAKVKANPDDYDQARDCLPYGMPYQMLLVAQYPLEIVQTDDQLTIIFELHNDVRRIYMDGRATPSGLRPTFMGYSIGHWEDETLVIETTAIRDGGMPRPHGPQFKVTERIRQITDKDGVLMLEDLMTIDDPQVYTEPFTVKTYFRQKPGLEVGEYFCSGDLWQLNLSGQERSIPWR